MSNFTITSNTAANDNAGGIANNLLPKLRTGMNAFTGMDTHINAVVNGQGGIGRRAMLAAYDFSCDFKDNPTEAAKLPGYKESKVPANANQYNWPLKMLIGDNVNNVIQSRICIFAIII